MVAFKIRISCCIIIHEIVYLTFRITRNVRKSSYRSVIKIIINPFLKKTRKLLSRSILAAFFLASFHPYSRQYRQKTVFPTAADGIILIKIYCVHRSSRIAVRRRLYIYNRHERSALLAEKSRR